MGKNKAKKKRGPVAGAPVELKKRPLSGAGPPEPDPASNLVFGLQRLDHEGPWSWTNVTGEQLRRIAEKCRGWESMRPNDVFASSGNKPVPNENLCKRAQDRLVAIELDDYDGLWELRVSGKERIWGLRERHIFYVLWWDPGHEVCPSNKRNT